MRVVQADDKLELVALKVDHRRKRGRRLDLTDDYKARMRYSRGPDGRPVIYSVMHKGELPPVSLETYDNMPPNERADYVPCFQREAELEGGLLLVERDNRIMIRATGLSKTERALLASRYRTVLDAAVGLYPGIMGFAYRTRARGGDTERRHRERVRQVLKARFRLSEYEYNILIMEPGLAARVMEDCRARARAVTGRTAYLKGYTGKGKPGGRTSVKCYDMAERHYPGEDAMRGLAKVEITLRADALRGIDLTRLTWQEDSIAAVRALALDELRKEATRSAIMAELFAEVVEHDEVLARLIRMERRQDGTDTRLTDAERRIAELERLIRQAGPAPLRRVR